MMPTYLYRTRWSKLVFALRRLPRIDGGSAPIHIVATLLVILGALQLSTVAHASEIETAKPPQGDVSPIDYAVAASWLCRPGSEEPCVADFSADGIDADGRRTTIPFTPASDPKVDCFYVYPAISSEPTFYASRNPAPVVNSIYLQVARLREVCRIFAPIYHQVTLQGLAWQMAHDGVDRSPAGVRTMERVMQEIPYRDVLTAWRHYLEHDNQGRGVVLVGHSQGSIIIKKLLADGLGDSSVRKRLVAVYLAGSPDFGTADLQGLPLCGHPDQFGCIVAFSTYPAGYAGARLFGQAQRGTPVCVNPASPGAPSAAIESAFTKRGLWGDTPPENAPRSDRKYVIWSGRLIARCVTDALGAALRVEPAPGAASADMARELGGLRRFFPPHFGLHEVEMQLLQVSLAKSVQRQSTAYLAAHPDRAR